MISKLGPVVAVLVLGLVIYNAARHGSAPEKAANDIQSVQAELRANYPSEHPEAAMTISQAWRTSGFGSIMMADFTIFNKNDFAVKDILVECALWAASGTAVGTAEKAILDIVRPQQKRTFRDVNMGFINDQTAKAGCEIKGAKIAE